MDSTTLLALAISALSLMLVGVGVYGFLVLRDLRQAVGRFNRILGRVDTITEHIDSNLVKPASSLAGILTVLRDGVQIVNEIKHLSVDTAETAKVVAKEAKQVSQVVKEEVVPAATEAMQEVAKGFKEDVIPEAAVSAKEVAKEAVQQAKEVVTDSLQPEPMKAGSLATGRRFFRKRK